MLALLLLEPGRAVSDDRLTEELWRGEPPPGAATTLRVYVSRLRGILADAPISRSGAGYLLDVPPERVDAHRFERLLAEGQEALARGSARRAASRLAEALELWRGRPFGALTDEGALAVEARRLEELHVLALEAQIEAKLQLGRDAELVDELEALLSQHPYRERLWGHLMLALYRAGRQAEALAAYRRAWTLLDERLGVEPSEELRALEQAILRHEVPVARPPEERHNLPAPLTSFVGRDAELTEVERLLGEARLLTLTGVGGVGKTRLALELARRSLAEVRDGAWFCDLSALAEPDVVPRAVASVLEVRDSADDAIERELVTRLREAELLLVLDNAEHVREATAELAHFLLAACPRLRVLATSREPLGVPGEVGYPVPPLGLPPPDATPEEIRSSEAVRLFLERARTARPHLTADERAMATTARICSDLDGLPLAIELAAARARALSLDDIADRLADRFRFLVSWRRLAAARHRTLREAMDWSYGLLARDAQELLARLSVFAGGFTLPAVAAVCLDDDEERALTLVERLVDASLVVAEMHQGEMRYRLLETVRQYADAALREQEAADEIRRRHAAYYLELAEHVTTDIYEHGTFVLTRLDPDDANLRASLRHLQEAGSIGLQLRLCAALWRYWWLRGEIADGRRRLEAVLERDTGEASLARAEALRGASTFALRQGDYAAAVALAEEAVGLSGPLGALPVARARVALGNAVGSLGEANTAERLYGEATAAFRAAGRTWELANALLNMGDLAVTRGDLDRAERIASESLALSRTLGEEVGVGINLGNLAFIALERGEADRASDLLEEGLAHVVGFVECTAIMVVGLAAVASARGGQLRAAELLGASERLIEEAGSTLDSIERRVDARTRATVREHLGEEQFAAAVEAGRQLPMEDVVEVALAG